MKKSLLYLILGGVTYNVAAQDVPVEDSHCLVHTTYVWQRKPAFTAQPGTTNPLNQAEINYGLNVVLHLAKRVWTDGEVYYNAEAEKSGIFSGMADVGGPTTFEDGKMRGVVSVYNARLYLRQTFGLGGGSETITPSENQLAGSADKNRIVMTVGHFSPVDIFGKNGYTFDPTVHFLNWSNTTYAAYDYAADQHGYTWGAAGEWYQGDWTLRLGYSTTPTTPHGTTLDSNLLQHYGNELEVEHRHQLAGQDGKIRLLAWRNRAVMGRFQDAIALKGQNNQTPDVSKVRFGDQVKYGVGIDVEQGLTSNLGAFFRFMQTDGRSETLSYLEVDHSISAGLALKGGAWNRSDDLVGVSLKGNALSADRRAYLQAGGVSVFNIQGMFQYRPEVIFETFYNWQFAEGKQFTLDYQHITNPSFNFYRGSVDVYGARLHVEY
jgi:hypothetical protein